MVIEIKDFFPKMLALLPSTYTAYEASVNRFGTLLETVVIEDVFMPVIISLLRTQDDIDLINNIFEYFEDVSKYGNDHLINVFSVTVLEKIVDDDVLEESEKYAGEKTKELLKETIKNM